MKRFLLLLLFAGAAGTLWFVTPHGLERDLCRAVRGVDAEVGIAVVREGRVIASVGGDRPMPAMSTFKFPLALAVATRLDSLGLPLSAQLEVTGDDLWPDTWSPLREAHPAGGRFSFGELLRYTVAESDNCACDRLIREIGGIGALQRYVEGLPAEGLDFRMTEREMSGAPDAQRRNRATPEAMALLNELYLLRGDGCFSTIDLLELDLCTAEGVLYKWGAAPSYLKKGGNVKKIGTASPPPGLGVGEEHRAGGVRLSLQRGELLVLTTDGVPEAACEQYLRTCGALSPRELAAGVVACASESEPDDRTAAAVQLEPVSLQPHHITRRARNVSKAGARPHI